MEVSAKRFTLGTFLAPEVSNLTAAILLVGQNVADSTVGLHFDTCIGSYASAEDDALIAALRAGVEEAYETLILRYQQPVYNLVARLMSDPGDSADVVQEVFLKIF